MEKKYELTEEFLHSSNGTRMFRIKALVNIPFFGIKAGDLGGFIESVNNLQQEGNAWIMPNCHVFGESEIKDDVLVKNGAEIQDSHLSDTIMVSGIIKIKDSYLSGRRFRIEGEAILDGCELRGEDILIKGKTMMQNVFCDHQLEQFELSGEARIENTDNHVMNIGGFQIKITDKALVKNAWNLKGNHITIQDNAVIEAKATLHGNHITIKDMAVVGKNVSVYDNVELSECAKLISADINNFLSISDVNLNGDIEFDIAEL